ncbi:MAG TPA: hypothetical protein VFU25_10975, partial [Ornithinibacter sp.]|nr:hypothetical protein [Ornithinibacter sp.]
MTLLVVLFVAAAVLSWPTRRAAPSRPRGRSTAGAATVEEAAAALGLVSAALRGGTGAVEALEAVARVDVGAAGRELAVVAAAHRWGEAPQSAWSRVGPGWTAAAVAWHAA